MANNKNIKYPDRVTEMFSGKSIFVTGGSGFIGKVFIEKILRECTDIKYVYLLLRSKKGKTPQTRLEEILAGPLFEKLKTIQSKEFLYEKCKVIAGDCSDINLGISEEDRKTLIANVNYMYHIAASVRFDEPLKSAILLNTRGTKYMLELAKQCKRLEFFCYVSTAYVHPNEKILEEKSYPPPTDPHKMINLIENMSTENVDLIAKNLLADLPNNYTFSKSLSEAIVVEQMNCLPIIIVRPSVVVPVWKEPLPGWTDNINGPVGLIIGSGKGVIRSVYCKINYYADFIPVDFIAKGLILVTFDYLTFKERRIYNFTTSDELRLTWKELLDLGKKIIYEKIPFNYVPWYPGGTYQNYRFIHNLSVFFFQLLPAILADTLLFCLGIKPVLWRVQKRVLKGYEVLEYYATNQWQFVKNNSDIARKKLNPKEKEVYYIPDGPKEFDVEQYFTDIIHGARLYILHESDDTIPRAKTHMKIMWCVDKLFKLICLYFIISMIYNAIF